MATNKGFRFLGMCRAVVSPHPAANDMGDRQTGGKSTRQEIKLLDGDRARLEGTAGHPRSPQKHGWRARIILELGSGYGLMETMLRTGMSRPTVRRWRDRFLEEGVDGLPRDATRPPGRKPVSGDKVKAPVALAMSPPPPDGSMRTSDRHDRAWRVRPTPESARPTPFPSFSSSSAWCSGRGAATARPLPRCGRAPARRAWPRRGSDR